MCLVSQELILGPQLILDQFLHVWFLKISKLIPGPELIQV